MTACLILIVWMLATAALVIYENGHDAGVREGEDRAMRLFGMHSESWRV